MRFTATITVEMPIEEDDLTAQRAKVLAAFEAVQAVYPDARIKHVCRTRRAAGGRRRSDQPKHYTGRMRDYH